MRGWGRQTTDSQRNSEAKKPWKNPLFWISPQWSSVETRERMHQLRIQSERWDFVFIFNDKEDGSGAFVQVQATYHFLWGREQRLDSPRTFLLKQNVLPGSQCGGPIFASSCSSTPWPALSCLLYSSPSSSLSSHFLLLLSREAVQLSEIVGAKNSGSCRCPCEPWPSMLVDPY